MWLEPILIGFVGTIATALSLYIESRRRNRRMAQIQKLADHLDISNDAEEDLRDSGLVREDNPKAYDQLKTKLQRFYEEQEQGRSLEDRLFRTQLRAEIKSIKRTKIASNRRNAMRVVKSAKT